MNSSYNHEMLAPIRSIIQIAENMLHSDAGSIALKTIIHTSSFLLNQVHQNLDQSLLEQQRLQPRLEDKQLREDVLDPVCELFQVQAKQQKVRLKLNFQMRDFLFLIDVTRTK